METGEIFSTSVFPQSGTSYELSKELPEAYLNLTRVADMMEKFKLRFVKTKWCTNPTYFILIHVAYQKHI